ncbi:MAG: phage portal protein [Paracoccaceae bacterium]
MFDRFRRKDDRPAQAKASRAARPALGTGRVAWGARDAAGLARAGFSSNPVGFRAVKLIAEAAASIDVICQDRTRRYELHPALTLLARPNAAQTGPELMEAAYGQYLLTGDAFLEAVGEEAPDELHVLRSDRTRREGAGFVHTVEGRTHRFADAEICHVRAFHPHDDHHGLSPLTAAATAVDVHAAASRWSKALLDNAARPSGAIVVSGGDGVLGSDQYDRLVAEMEMQHQGARNAGRPMLLEGGLDWKPMGFSPSDMEFHRTKEAAAREIATAFGVPPMLLGIPGDATYANYAEANRAFWRLTVLPLAAKMMGALSVFLSTRAGEPFELRPDLDAIPALAPEREALWRRVGGAAFLTDAEKRALLGLPAAEVGA